MPDYTKLQYYSGANTFKNVGVFDTSVTLSGSVGAGVEVTNSSVVTLLENQVFVFAAAEYIEFTKGGSATWQPFPTFDANIVTSVGSQTAYLLATINGTTVTFTAGYKNAGGAGVTLTSTTYNIQYTTYTLVK